MMNSRERMFVKAYGSLINRMMMKPIIEDCLNYAVIDCKDLSKHQIADVYTAIAETCLEINQFEKFMELYY